MRIERYAVHWVSLDPVVGREFAKTRPAAIVSDAAMNEHLDTVVVCPITSRLHPRWPSRVQTTVGGKPGEVAVDQIRTIAKAGLGPRIGVLEPEAAASIRHVITEMYGLLSVTTSER